MKNYFWLPIIGLFVSSFSFAQGTIEAAWLSQFDNPDPSDLSYQLKEMIVDSEGNCILAFNTVQEVDFGGGYIYDKHYFTIVKIDSTNSLLWKKDMMVDQLQVHEAKAYFSGMTIDEDDNVYINANFETYIAPGMHFDTIFVYGEGELLGKLNSNGHAIWATVHNAGHGTGLNYSDGHIYGVGHHYGDIDVGPFTATLNSQTGGVETYVYKMDTSGAYIWLEEIDHFAGASSIFAYQQELYVAGYHSASSVFPGNNAAQSSGGNFVLNLDTAGTFAWLNEYGNGPSIKSLLRIDSSLYVAGSCPENFSFESFTAGSGHHQNFVLALDTLGNEKWLHSFSSQTSIDITEYSNKLMILSRVLSGSTLSTIPSFNHAFIALIESDGFVTNYVEKLHFIGGQIYGTSNGAYFSCGNPGEIWIGNHYKQGVGHACGRIDKANYLSYIEQDLDVLIYPNPTQDLIYIDFKFSHEDEVLLLNSQGKKVATSILESANSTCLDLTSCPDGVYFLIVKKENNWTAHKIVKR